MATYPLAAHVAELLANGKGYELTKTGVVFHRVLSDDEFDALGLKIARFANATAWALGDWLVAGGGRGPDGHVYDRGHEVSGRSYASLQQYARVSEAYAHDDRALVPWSFYREALRLPTRERLDALGMAKVNNWTVVGLIDHINVRQGEMHSLLGGHQKTGSLVRTGRRVGWIQKRRVRCPKCNHAFDVRRKEFAEAHIEATDTEPTTP